MLKACDVQWWDQSPRVFNVQRRFGIDTILREKLVDCGPEKFAIDQDVERYATVVIAM